MNPDDNTPLNDLADWIRSDRHGEQRMSAERMADASERAIAEGRRRTEDRQRRRRRAVVAISAATVLATGTAVAAAVIWSDKPTRPQAGTVCRATADLDAHAIVLGPDQDPTNGCRALWDDGAFKEFGVDHPPASLAACISKGGTIDVLPGAETVCAQLGLAVADTRTDPENEKLLELQERLIEEINKVDCLTTDQATTTARRILDDLALDDWPVDVNADAVRADCAKAGIGEDNRSVFINHI